MSRLVDKWDAVLPPRKYQPDGTETWGSRVLRWAEAERLEKQSEKSDDRLKTGNEKEAELRQAEEVRLRNQAEDTAFWNGIPSALRAMGLGEAQISQIGGLELNWPGMPLVAEWKASGKLFLVLGGPPGTGKTLAAARVLLDEGQERVRCESYDAPQWRTAWAKFARASDLSRFSYYDKQDQQYLKRLENARWLVLDDLGAESMSDPWRATLLELVDKRMAEGRRTLITTNLDGKAFRERYDARVMRRLTEFGQFAAVRTRERQAG